MLKKYLEKWQRFNLEKYKQRRIMANIEFKPIAAGFKFLDLIEIESIPDRTKDY